MDYKIINNYLINLLIFINIIFTKKYNMNTLDSEIPEKWRNEIYQNIELIEYELSQGPLINVIILSGETFKCKLLDLKKNIIEYFNNIKEIHLSIIINNDIISSPYLDTLIFMLESYITNNIEELNISILLENNIEYYESEKYNKEKIIQHIDYRALKVRNFFDKIKNLKNNKFNKILLNEYNITINEKTLHFIDFYDKYLTKCKNYEEEKLYYSSNNNHDYYDDDYDKYEGDKYEGDGEEYYDMNYS